MMRKVYGMFYLSSFLVIVIVVLVTAWLFGYMLSHCSQELTHFSGACPCAHCGWHLLHYGAVYILVVTLTRVAVKSHTVWWPF